MAPQTPSLTTAPGAAAAAAPAIAETVIQVDDKLYSAEMLAASHPGGELFVRAFAGRDATDAFISYHRRSFPHGAVKAALVGTRPVTHPLSFDKDYLELCNLIDKNVLPRNQTFAPFSYFVKIFVLISLAISLEYYMHVHSRYVWYLSAMLGWLFALIGLNIQHDANHGSVSRNPAVNRALGLFQNWIGGSALDWIHQHDVQHHVHTNDLNEDPDIIGNPILRINPHKPLFKIHAFQYLYVFVLLGAFGFTYSMNSVRNAIFFGNYTNYSNMLRKFQFTDLCMISLFHLRLTVLPILNSDTSAISTFLNILPIYLVGGYYLAFFFLISHNFEGVHFFDTTKEKKSSESFLYAQVASSSNVGGPFLAFLNGGLNYQIEHHLFPRIQHSHYARISPFVREFCATKGIPYVHFPTIWENIVSTSHHLLKMGTIVDPIKSG